MNIVLVTPEIPPNTGNVARLCAGTGARLHLVKPLGFSVDDRQLKRAGLDYWNLVDITYYENLDHFLQVNQGARMWFFSTRGNKYYHEVEYMPTDFLVFGRETKGLPEELLAEQSEQLVRIPLQNGARSLNLSNAVAVVTYEAMRQSGFPWLR